MPLTEAEEFELLSMERERALSDYEVSKPEAQESFLSKIGGVANDINQGIVGTVPGLTYFANKVGIGVDKTPEEDSLGEAGLKALGMAIATIPAILAAPLRAAAGPISEQLTARTMAATQAEHKGISEATTSFLNNTANSAVAAPGKFYGSESAAGFSAGVIGQAAFNSTESESARFAGELIGGSIPGTLPHLLSKVPDVTLTRLAANKVRQLFTQDNMEFGKGRAADRIRSATDIDPIDALNGSKNADVLPNAHLTTIEKSGDDGLLSLEASVRNETDALTRAERQRFTSINSVIEAELKDVVDGDASFQDTRNYLSLLMDERIKIAGVNAEKSISALGQVDGREASSVLARKELNRAYESAANQEAQLWARVDKKTTSDMESTLDTYESLRGTFGDNRVSKVSFDENLPKIVKDQIGTYTKKGKFKEGALKGSVSVGELQALRSELLRGAREEARKQSPNRKKLSIINELQSAVLSDLEKVQGDETLSLARAFSNDLNKRFREGDVGQILGFSSGGETIENLTLQGLLNRSRIAGASAVDNLVSAAPEMKPHIENYVLSEFIEASTKGGDFNPVSGRSYINNKKDVLSRLDSSVVGKMEESVRQNKILKEVVQASKSPDSITNILLKQPVEREISYLKRSSFIDRELDEINNLLKGSRKAQQGFSRAVIDDLLEISKSGNGLDLEDKPFISGHKIQESLEQKNYKKIIDNFLSKDQKKKLVTITNTAKIAARSRQQNPTKDGILTDDEGLIISSMRDILGAKLGRSFGIAIGSPGTVQIPGKFVWLSRKLQNLSLDPAKELLTSAIMSEDDKLLKAILAPDSISKIEFESRINAWIIDSAAKYGLGEVESEEE